MMNMEENKKQLIDPDELKFIRELMLMWRRSYKNGKEGKSKL